MVFTVGLVCGAALGAAFGLLYAPKPGDEMRRDLRNRADRFSRKARSMYDRATDAVGDFAERGADVLDHAADAANSLSGSER
jgi:gas vesicle protein